MDQKHNLQFTLDKMKCNLSYKPPNKSRQLVSVTSNLANCNKEALIHFYNKLVEYRTILSNCNLSSHEVMKGYNTF